MTNRAFLQKQRSIQYNEASFQVITISAYVRGLKLDRAYKLNQRPVVLGGVLIAHLRMMLWMPTFLLIAVRPTSLTG